MKMSAVVQRKKATKEAASASTGSESGDKSAKFKTPAPRFRNQKVFVRVILSSAVFIVVYFTSNKEKTTTLAGVKELLSLREHKLDCSPESFTAAIACGPVSCGRFASDNVISETELVKLKDLTTGIFKRFFKDDEESSLTFDLHSELLAKHETMKKNIDEILKALQPKLIDTISQRFGTAHKTVALTSPSYISKITNVTTEFSERLHQLHYDIETSPSIHFTLIIYLSNFKKDLVGGKFIFVDVEKKKKKNVVVEPKAGRTIGFTTGSENNHLLEKIKSGASYFVTLSFTCNSKTDKDDKMVL